MKLVGGGSVINGAYTLNLFFILYQIKLLFLDDPTQFTFYRIVHILDQTFVLHSTAAEMIFPTHPPVEKTDAMITATPLPLYCRALH